MQMSTQTKLLAAIDAFLARHPEIGEARFGRDATGEPGLISTIRKGRQPTLRIADKITDYMAAKDAELAASADHDAIDTTGDEVGSSGKADDVSAPPDPPFPDPIRRTDDPAPRTATPRESAKEVEAGQGRGMAERSSCAASPTNSPAPSRTSGGCSTATEIAREVAA